MIYETKYQRRIRGRIDDLVDEMGRLPTSDEVIAEFKKKGFHRPFRKVVLGILEGINRPPVASG